MEDNGWVYQSIVNTRDLYDGSPPLYLSKQKHDVISVRQNKTIFIIKIQQTNGRQLFNTAWIFTINFCSYVCIIKSIFGTDVINSTNATGTGAFLEVSLTADLPALHVCRTNEIAPRSWPDCWERTGNKGNYSHRPWRQRSSESWLGSVKRSFAPAWRARSLTVLTRSYRWMKRRFWKLQLANRLREEQFGSTSVLHFNLERLQPFKTTNK